MVSGLPVSVLLPLLSIQDDSLPLGRLPFHYELTRMLLVFGFAASRTGWMMDWLACVCDCVRITADQPNLEAPAALVGR
jgi:hypothetical protein